MHTAVLVEAGALGKRLVALSAREGPETCVDKHVAPQIPGSYKGLVTALAFVRPLSRVNTFVHGQIGWLPEPFGTLITGVGLETQVGPLVSTETGGVRKHLAALGAEERLLTRMSAEMRLVGGQLGEALATLLTLIGLVLGVNALMAGQRGGSGEGFATVRAQVGFFSSVGALVVFQVLQLCVRFPALLTCVRPMTLVVPPVFSEH